MAIASAFDFMCYRLYSDWSAPSWLRDFNFVDYRLQASRLKSRYNTVRFTLSSLFARMALCFRSCYCSPLKCKDTMQDSGDFPFARMSVRPPSSLGVEDPIRQLGTLSDPHVGSQRGIQLTIFYEGYGIGTEQHLAFSYSLAVVHLCCGIRQP